MRASRIDPTISAYDILHGPYDWNRYPLAPLGCKVVVYEDRDTRGSWASRGVDGWYLGPSMDHYRCDIYYIPETQAYRISGSTELFPQHCQLPDMTPHQISRALTDGLTDRATEVTHTLKGKCLLWLLQDKITTMFVPPPILEEQRVANHNIIFATRGRTKGNQRLTHYDNRTYNSCTQHCGVTEPNRQTSMQDNTLHTLSFNKEQ